MRLLIDGYNLMHAVVLQPGRRLSGSQLRQKRQRFLNDLATRLGPDLATQTTIVFDSTDAPAHLPRTQKHRGIEVLFADADQDADERIEILIAQHSAPKSLTVVSTDQRVRLAAKRRRATTETSDAFWTRLENRPARRIQQQDRTGPPKKMDEARRPDSDESAYWLAQFGHLDDSPELRAAARPADFVPSDEELARIAREVDQESSWDR